ncbi:MAG TPA: DUF2953 domain-containing protein [Thermoanaerobacterales bacterium]|uniref:DUF2953 domain-containing protein n=1 Tax=Tepidanaerobacter sp. GT38 TaxID=2722793 RepID=UPI0017E68DB3|nr:DUF2953 domain-containing protein [Tepidanaerobacter sp. GT38]HHY41278.1 DUF2953 domain-containing protein [Thermoanaerobacterales bacterium]
MIQLLIILAFSLVFFLPVKFHIMLFKKARDEHIKLEISLCSLSKIVLEIPEMKFTIRSFIPLLSFRYKMQSKKKGKIKSRKVVISPLRDRFKVIINILKFCITYLKTFKKLINILLNKVNVTYLNIDIAFGSENPALTGFFAGYIWSAIYQILGFLSMHANFAKADVKTNVRPNFLEPESFQIDVNCIFHLRVGYIIIASLIIAWYWLLFNIRLKQKAIKKTSKGATLSWMNIQFRV